MISRAQFLRGDFRNRRPPQRPPWAAPESTFIQRCSGCADCLSQCPTGIIRMYRGFPEIDFKRGECSFCRACVEACPSGALQACGAPPWQLRVRIQASCLALQGVECRVCGEQCEAHAIRHRLVAGGVAQPELETLACTGCGACIAPCPTDAIRMQPDTDPRGGPTV
ncbi:MAG TPA: ferredoxin-type protein NapF [Thiohalobacter sp.]|nr:ferredoxin-type protein NapF [Thiohalobacter sp.]